MALVDSSPNILVYNETEVAKEPSMDQLEKLDLQETSAKVLNEDLDLTQRYGSPLPLQMPLARYDEEAALALAEEEFDENEALN